jgi:hypothetical protein
MSLSKDVVSSMVLGDVLEVPGLFRGIDPNEPTLLALIEVKKGVYRFNVSYMNIRIGTATLKFLKKGPTLTLE